MKKVLLVHSSFPHNGKNYGGAKKMITWVGNNLAKEGFDVTFCSVYGKERADSFCEITKSIELSVNIYKSFFQRNVTFFYDFGKRLNRLFKQNHYDCVISFGETSYFVLLLYKYIYQYKLIVSERLDPVHDSGFFNKLRRRLYDYSDVLVCQSDGAKHCFSTKAQHHSVVIPNPIEPYNDTWNIRSSTNAICTAGRLDIKQKRQDVLLMAFEKFLRNHKDYVLNIYGGGPDESKLRALAEKLNIKEHVHFHGNTRNVQAHIISNKLFVLTSDFEGVPNALLEAMAVGIPVISTRCSPGGAEMVISEGENGYLTDCGDFDYLAELLSSFVEKEEDLVRIGKEGKESLIRFKPEVIIKEWMKIIN